MQFLCSFYSSWVCVFFFFGVFCLSISRSICEVCYLPLPFVWFGLPFAPCVFFYFFAAFLLWVSPCCWFCAFVLGRIFDIFVLLTNLRRTMQTNTVHSPAHRYKCICSSSVVSFFPIFVFLWGRGDKWLAAFQYGANWVFNCLTLHLLTSFFAHHIGQSARCV